MELTQALSFLHVATPKDLIIEWLPGQGSERVSMAELIRALQENSERCEGRGSIERLVLIGFRFDPLLDYAFSDLAYGLLQLPSLKKVYFYDCMGQDSCLLQGKETFDAAGLNFFEALNTRWYQQTKLILTDDSQLKLGTAPYYLSLQGLALAFINSLLPEKSNKHDLKEYRVDEGLQTTCLTVLYHFFKEKMLPLMFCGSLPEDVAELFDQDVEALHRLIARIFMALIVKQKVYLETETVNEQVMRSPQALKVAIIFLNFTRCLYQQIKLNNQINEEAQGYLSFSVETLCIALQTLRCNPWGWFNPLYEKFQNLQIKEIDLRSKRAPEEARRRVTAEKTAIINQLHEMLQLLYPLEMVQQPEENHADFGYFSNAIYNWCDQLFDFVTFYFNESIHQKKKREKEKLAWSLWSESNFENLAKHQERIEAKKGAAPDVR